MTLRFAIAACFWAGAAAAQPAATPADASGVTSYPPAFFADAAPNSALDMVRRLPGFSYDAGATGSRGLSGAQGNVLIDGQRPSTKATSLDDILGRIQPSSVVRIDMVRSGASGIDMQGRPVVANVIRRPGADRTAAVQIGPKTTEGMLEGEGRVEWSQRSGRLALEASAGFERETHPSAGAGRLTRRGAEGGLRQTGGYRADFEELEANVSGAAEFRLGEGVMRVNLAAALANNDKLDRAALKGAGGAVVEETRGLDRNRSGEIGLDYERRLGTGTTLRLLGLQKLARERGEDRYVDARVVEAATDSARIGETVARGSLFMQPSEALTLDVGTEAAFNVLDAASSLARDGRAIDLPNANARVEERRGEASAVASLAVNPTLNLEFAARYEVSRISQSGDADRARTFGFVKPRLLAAWRRGQSEFRVRIERQVGQLNFRDFAASTELDSGTVRAGAADLRPETWWTAEAAFEQRFWDRGALMLSFRREWVDGQIDMVPIFTETASYDAPGNLADAVRDFAKANLTLPLDRLGMAGGLFRIEATWRWSALDDPLTHSQRPVSWQRPFQANVWLSKDMPALNSTVMLTGNVGWREKAYRIREVKVNAEEPWLTLYWDWRARPDLTIRAEVENIWARERRRERTFFAGSRATDVIASSDVLTVDRDRTFMLRVRKTL